MNPAPPVMRAFRTALRAGSRRTARRDRNICTVSSENASRSLPSRSSFAIRSFVIVMMWQPIESA